MAKEGISKLIRAQIPSKRLLSDSHEWVELSGQIATIGITHSAQKELGEIVYVQLPNIGDQVNKGQEICVLESTKAASDIYTPLSGKVVEINHQLLHKPQVINEMAESSGWLFRLELSNVDEISELS